jgi:hypothetical protein
MTTLSKADQKKIRAMAARPRANKEARSLLLDEVAPLVSDMTDAIMSDGKPSAHMLLRAAAWEARAERAGIRENVDLLCLLETSRRKEIAWAAERARQSKEWRAQEFHAGGAHGIYERPQSMSDRTASGGTYSDWFAEDAIAPSFELPDAMSAALFCALDDMRGEWLNTCMTGRRV